MGVVHAYMEKEFGENGRGNFRLNPYLFADTWSKDDPKVSVATYRCIQMNWHLARVLGLHSKAEQLVSQLFTSLHKRTTEANVRLTLLGPIFRYPWPASYQTQILKQLEQTASENKITFISIAKLHDLRFRTENGYHLNAEGHRRIADMLYPELLPND